MDRGLRRKHLFFNPLEQATGDALVDKFRGCFRSILVTLRCLLIAPTMLCLAGVELFLCGFLALCGAGLINEACTSIHVCNSESMKRRYS